MICNGMKCRELIVRWDQALVGTYWRSILYKLMLGKSSYVSMSSLVNCSRKSRSFLAGQEESTKKYIQCKLQNTIVM